MRSGKSELTDLGRLMSKEDPTANHPWTWWLFHLNLCSNVESFPYSAFFTGFQSEGSKWLLTDDIVKTVTERARAQGNQLKEKSVKTYFEGVEGSFKPGRPLYDLGLIQRRSVDSERRERIRRTKASPEDIIIAYATLIFKVNLHPSDQTIETRILLEDGVGNSLGINNIQYRDALVRIHQDNDLGQFIGYSKVANLDSVQFRRVDLHSLSVSAYQSGGIKWP